MNTIETYKKKLAESANVNWNAKTEVEFLWTYTVKASVDKVWNYLADTSRFNRELGLAPREQKEVDGKVVVNSTILGIRQEWIEEPWMWIAGQTITSERTYIRGMAKSVQAVFHLDYNAELMQTNVYIYFGWIPKNNFWKFFLKNTENILKNKFQQAFLKIENYLQTNINAKSTEAFRKENTELDLDQKMRLYKLSEELIAKDLDKAAITKLVQYLEKGDELELDSLRILRLAHQWNLNYKELLRVCLHGSRMGMFVISWDVVCPHCRGARFTANKLGEIPSASSCVACDLEFETSSKEAIEIVFKVHPSIRKISTAVYCAAEPAKKNHIKIQQKISPNSEVEFILPQVEGLYRARLKGETPQLDFAISSKVSAQTLNLDFSNANETPTQLGSNSKLIFKNKFSKEIILIVEQIELNDLILRPGHLLFFSEFRDLFSEEHLRADVKLHLGEHALLFTDIVGSTVFYDKVGDATAFAEVRKHFVEVFSVVKSFNGDVVKTIGDAVMAAFPTITEAYAAAVEIQNKFHSQRPDTKIRLRASIHHGVVIAVHLETGVDYFGSTINKCAKIQGLAGAGEIVMTEKVYDELKLNEKKLKIENQVYAANTDSPVPVKVISIS